MIWDLLEKRTIGLNFSNDGSSEFCLWAPSAENIELIINDDLILKAEKKDYGFWNLKTKGINPGDSYLVRMNQSEIFPDPASLSQPEGVNGPSVAYDLPDFSWEDKQWKGIKDEGNIFYELHTGTFTEPGTFEGIAGKIEYLKELGINIIEIMPVSQFPGTRNWGYDGVYPFAVQYSYGGARGLQQLVNLCHKNGLSVVLDVVYNHLGPEGNYLNEFGPHFTDKYKTPWGKAVNFDDEWCDGVRRFYIENMLMWFRDFHIDGLRLDAVHAIRDFSPKHILRELREYADSLETRTGRKYLLIAEIDLNDTRYINPPMKDGYGLDMQWCDEFHHAVHAFVTKERNGYYADFGELKHIIKSLDSGYVYDGSFSSHRKKFFGSNTAGIPGNKFIVFIQNHDHVGNRMLGDRIGNFVNTELLKLMAGTVFISPFVPLLFMGEEYNETNPFSYFTSHTDENLAELVKKGRANEFKDFMDEDNAADPQSEDLFQNSKLTFNISGNNQFIYQFYRELIRLKKFHLVWKDYDRTNVTVEQAGNNAVLFSKRIRDNQLIAVLNFNNQKFFHDLKGTGNRKFHVILNSADKRWGGLDPDPVFESNVIKAEPFSIIVISDIQ